MTRQHYILYKIREIFAGMPICIKFMQSLFSHMLVTENSLSGMWNGEREHFQMTREKDNFSL